MISGVLASSNAGKLRELQALLQPFNIRLQPQSDFAIADADETGLTFVENALIKARHAARLTGLPALADDSGLAVDLLGGAPGIYSARYAERQGLGQSLTANPTAALDRDSANNAALTQVLQSYPGPYKARYHCVLVWLRHAEDPLPLICEGTWEGEIQLHPQGQGGFGYDPYFWLAEYSCTAAELDTERKNHLSHRAQACKALTQALQQAGPLMQAHAQ